MKKGCVNNSAQPLPNQKKDDYFFSEASTPASTAAGSLSPATLMTLSSLVNALSSSALKLIPILPLTRASGCYCSFSILIADNHSI
jgi:hypothetical protein